MSYQIVPACQNMDLLLNCFDTLSVGLQPPLVDSPPCDETIQELISYYRPFQLYSEFDPESINYLCALATRYAHATFRNTDEIALRAYALWLSLIWLIDGFFDKCKSLTSQKDVDTLIQIFQGELIEEPNHILFEVVIAIYDRYLDMIAPYCMDNLPVFSELTNWLIRYLNTLIVPITPRKLHRKIISGGSSRMTLGGVKQSILEYTEWRLDSGAMMCVVWHLVLFNKLPINTCFFRLFRLAAIVVSFHNDIISYRRDLQQKTPNLVSVVRELEEIEDFEAMRGAVDITDRVYTDITVELARLGISHPDIHKDIGPIVLDILEGSYSWAYSEPRYAIGIDMLRVLKDNDKKQFYTLLFHNEKTPGDPKKDMRTPRSSPRVKHELPITSHVHRRDPTV